MQIKKYRVRAGLTQQKMSEIFDIPKRTLESWEMGERKCPGYVEKLILEKLEGIAMEKGRNILKKAMEINEFNHKLPEVEIGDIVELRDVWDGNGDAPEQYYSYLLTHDGMDGESNIDVYISYDFEIIEEKNDPSDTLVKITDIDFC